MCSGNDIVVVSGGTATNELVSLFKSLSDRVTYILPVLDNGGSTSEILRVIGGPAIGDLRSRLNRLIPERNEHIRRLLSYRMSEDARSAKHEWEEIVDGIHPLWNGFDKAEKEIFRSFLIHVHVELLKKSRSHPSNQFPRLMFHFELANIGNLFFTGARLFVGSLDSAVVLFSRLTGIDEKVQVIPCINTNFTYHIAAALENGLIITGQSQISHPSCSLQESLEEHLQLQALSVNTIESHPFGANASHFHSRKNDDMGNYLESEFSEDSEIEESGNVPFYVHPELKKSQLHFNKVDSGPLLSPIKRIFYISPYGEEIRPSAYHKVLSSIVEADVLVYSIGSLMTSISPVIILNGVGKAIARDSKRSLSQKKVILLNGEPDRETFGMTAVDFVKTIVNLASYSLSQDHLKSSSKCEDPCQDLAWNRYVTHLFYIKGSGLHVDKSILEAKENIKCIEVALDPQRGGYDLTDLESKFKKLLSV